MTLKMKKSISMHLTLMTTVYLAIAFSNEGRVGFDIS